MRLWSFPSPAGFSEPPDLPIPSVLAGIGHARHRRGIALLNLSLGWTVLGWIAALVWVLFDEHGNDPEWP